MALPVRLDDDTLASVENWLARPIPPLEVADRDYVLQFIRLLSDMPRRGDDDATGQVRAENILAHLVGMPRAQLTWMAREAHVRWTFFPSVKQLVDLAAEWTRDDSHARARKLATVKVERERQYRLADARRRLKWEPCEQAWIDALPEGVKRALEAESLLHRCPDCGSFAQAGHWRRYHAFLAAQEQAA
jgi:hypothetical protein